MRINNVEVSGLIVLFVGVILLAFTFFSAYAFLSEKLSILTSADLTKLFGEALGPLIEAVIRILYLGIMGWIGSILTIRGVQLLKQDKETAPTQPQVKAEAKPSAPPALPAAPAVAPTPKAEAKLEVKESKKEETPEKTSGQKQPKETEKEAQAK